MTERISKTFREWLRSDEPLVVAEGYLLEFERRGYLRAGDYIPEVVLEQPHLVRQLHEEFVHAGTDVTLSFTYYCHRKKLESVDRQHEVELLNRKALAIAKEVAQRTKTFFAGGICNTNVMSLDAAAEKEIREMYEEQVLWAKEGGVEFIVAESLNSLLEAKIAISVAKKFDLPVVVTFNLYRNDACVVEGMSAVAACKEAEAAGADVVGLNCGRGPVMMEPLLRQLRQVCRGPLAALPICYRTTERYPSWMSAKDPLTGADIFPQDIAAISCCVSDIENFAASCQALGIRYCGLCCGNSASLTRALAMSLGRSPPAARFACAEHLSLRALWSDDKNSNSNGQQHEEI